MKLSSIKTTAILCIAGLLFFSSCKKENSTQTILSEQEALVASEENTEADAAFDDVAEIGFSADADIEAGVSLGVEIPGSAAEGGLGMRFFEDLQFKVGPCTKIEVSPRDSSFPKTVTINYGEGCICRDGKFRKGLVTLYYTAPLRRPGAVLTITLRNYHVNRAHIEGVKTIKNLSADGAVKYSTSVENGKFTLPSGRGFSYEGIKMVTQIRGMETRTIRDDVYSIEGRNKTTYNNGVSVTKNTESPLIKPVSCNWIVKGVLKIKINDRTIYIDFGNGDCDNKATLKWANGEREITLP